MVIVVDAVTWQIHFAHFMKEKTRRKNERIWLEKAFGENSLKKLEFAENLWKNERLEKQPNKKKGFENLNGNKTMNCFYRQNV